MNFFVLLRMGASAILITIAGCSSSFKETYVSQLERWPGGEVSRLLPVQEKARLITSTEW